MDEKKIVSWGDLADVEDVFTKTVTCPRLTEKLGKEINVKVRGVTPMELVKALNFPMAEIDQMVQENAEGQAFVDAIQEHAKAFTVAELLDTMEAVVKVGLVEPDPTDGNLKKLSADFETMFSEIVGMTIPKGAAVEAGQFRPDGE